MRKLILLSIGLLTVITLNAQKINRELTSVKLKNIDGKVVDLKEQVKADRVTVIVFWATWCAPCKKELVNIDEVLDDWKDEYGIDLIAISIDDARNATKVKPYINGKGYTFPVLIDENQLTKPLFNYPTVPYTAIIDKTKHIVYTHNGYVEGDEFELEKKIKEVLGKK